MKLAYIDIETGGLTPDSSPILQLAGLIEVDDKSEEFNFYIKPFPKDKVEAAALAVNKLNPSEAKFEEPGVVYNKFIKLLGKYVNKFDKSDKLFFIGYNSHQFDMPFIRKFFEKNGDRYFGSWFHYPSIDVMIMAACKLIGCRHQMPDFKLSTVARQLGISLEDANFHAGEYDIAVTKEMYKLLVKGE